MKKSIVFFLVGLNLICCGQVNNNIQQVQSPNAASLGIYGAIDISPFTGLANIGIDAFQMKEGDITINGSLRYFSGGVKPESHPAWVGQNWTFSVGGVVTRKVNGGVDEVASSIPNSLNSFAYLYHYADLDNLSWSTTSFIQGFWPLPSTENKADPSPDEFFFNLPNGVSGSFLLNHKGNWIVKSKSNSDLKVNVEVNNTPFLLAPINFSSVEINRLIFKITIKDHLGYTYIYGNQNNAIEFSRGGHGMRYTNNEDIVANAWFLTKIISPIGNVVNFEYQRKEYQYGQYVSYPSSSSYSFSNSGSGFLTGYSVGVFGATNGSGEVSLYGQVISPAYLKKISGNSFSIDFNISETNELKYNYLRTTFANPKFDYADLLIQDYVSPGEADINPISKWYKLDNIVVKDDDNVIKETYQFEYNNLPNERLFLKKFIKKNLNYTGNDAFYNFTYNTSISLPAYNNRTNDQWGYYNANQFPLTGWDITKLEMNPSVAQAGILTSITFPTGGQTNFEYESNSYSSIIRKAGGNISLISGSGVGGGLRIKKITNIDNFGTQISKEYKYISSTNNLNSSGILAGNKKLDWMTGGNIGNPSVAQYSKINFNDAQNLNYTDGRDIVYTEVKEILANNSYNWYKFSNSDNNAFLDEAPLNNYSDAYSSFQGNITSSYGTPYLSHSSRDLERGNLLSKKSYGASGILLQKIENNYNDEPLRFSDNNIVRSFDIYNIVLSGNSGSGNYNFFERYFQPVKVYTYYPYLKSTIKTDYDQVGSNPIITQMNYTYGTPNHKQLRKMETLTSDGNVNKIDYIYTQDITDGTYTIPGLLTNQLAAINTMVITNNVTGAPIQISQSQNSTQLTTIRTNYQILNGLPLIESVQNSTRNNSLEYNLFVNSYDDVGNAQQVTQRGGLIKSYLWDYKKQFNVAQVVNASMDDVAYTSFETENTGGWQYFKIATLNSNAITGKKVYEISNSENIERNITTTKTYILSLWANAGVLVNGVGYTKLGSSLNGYTYYEWEISNASLITISSNASVYLDELRLYPKGGLMSTFTFEPLVGLTCKCDENNKLQFYEYDNLNRLVIVRDQDKKIIKKICYNYVGQPENCIITDPVLFYNTPQSANFTKACPCAQIGTVVYNIPANAFSSTISIIDANNIAIAFMNANGQAYANQVANCVPIACNGNDKKIINCVCETGIYGEISTVRRNQTCVTTYGYFFSDGTTIATSTETTPLEGGGCI